MRGRTSSTQVAASTPFTGGTALSSTNVQQAIEEADSGFSWVRLAPAQLLSIKVYRQMVTSQEFTIENTAELTINGEMVVIL